MPSIPQFHLQSITCQISIYSDTRHTFLHFVCGLLCSLGPYRKYNRKQNVRDRQIDRLVGRQIDSQIEREIRRLRRDEIRRDEDDRETGWHRYLNLSNMRKGKQEKCANKKEILHKFIRIHSRFDALLFAYTSHTVKKIQMEADGVRHMWCAMVGEREREEEHESQNTKREKNHETKAIAKMDFLIAVIKWFCAMLVFAESSS